MSSARRTARFQRIIKETKVSPKFECCRATAKVCPHAQGAPSGNGGGVIYSSWAAFLQLQCRSPRMSSYELD